MIKLIEYDLLRLRNITYHRWLGNMMAANEERAQLTAIIKHWNSVQSDLFAITLPNEVSPCSRVNLPMLIGW